MVERWAKYRGGQVVPIRKAIRPGDPRDENGYTEQERRDINEFGAFVFELLMVLMATAIIGIGIFWGPNTDSPPDQYCNSIAECRE